MLIVDGKLIQLWIVATDMPIDWFAIIAACRLVESRNTRLKFNPNRTYWSQLVLLNGYCDEIVQFIYFLSYISMS